MRRSRIDYRMQRRALLQDVTSGARERVDVCDAHPELLRAATHLGQTTDQPCPFCVHTLVHVHYIFDRDRSRNPGGRAVDAESLARCVDRLGDLQVYVVEVCRGCHWHHLVESYLLVPPARGRDTG